MISGRPDELYKGVSDEAVKAVDYALDKLRNEPERFSSVSKEFTRTDAATDDLCTVLFQRMTGDDGHAALFSALLTLALKHLRLEKVPADVVEVADRIVAQFLAAGPPALHQGLCHFLHDTVIPPATALALMRLVHQMNPANEIALHAACTVAVADIEMVPVLGVLTRYLHDQRMELRALAALGLIRLGVRTRDAAETVEHVFNDLDLNFQLTLLKALRDSDRGTSALRPLIENLLRRGDSDPKLHYLAAQLLPVVDSNAERVAATLLRHLTGSRFSEELLSGSINAFDAIGELKELEPVCLAHLAAPSVRTRRTASRGLFVMAPLSKAGLEEVAKRLPAETDMESLEFIMSAVVRCGEAAIPYLLPLIDAETEKGRLDLYAQCLAKIGRPGIEALSAYLEVTRSERLLHVILGCIQRSGHGALGIVKPLCQFLDSTTNEEHIVNAIISILSVSKKPTDALPTLLSLIAVRDDFSAPVRHWAMLGITLMKEEAIELLDRAAKTGLSETVRQKVQQIRDELAGGFDPQLAYLLPIKPAYLLEQFALIGSVLEEHPDWSLNTVTQYLNDLAVPHPIGPGEWKPTTVGKQIRELERQFGEGVRLTSRGDRKSGGLTSFGLQAVSDIRQYLKWLSRHRKAE